MNKLQEFLLSLVIFLVIVIVLGVMFISDYIGMHSFLFGYICISIYLIASVAEYIKK